MPVSTRSRTNLRANESELRTEISHEDHPRSGEPMVEIGVPEDRNAERNAQDIRDVPISNIPIGSHFETAPPFTLLQQHMDVSEFRELVYKLSDNQDLDSSYVQ